jgi:hypothetical protein
MNNIPGPHKVSEEAIRLAEEHSEESQRHGRSIEALGKKLQENEDFDLEAARQIEASGKAAQQHAQRTLQDVDKLRASQSTEDYIKISQNHIEEAQSHIEATKAYGKILAQRIQESKAVQEDSE